VFKVLFSNAHNFPARPLDSLRKSVPTLIKHFSRGHLQALPISDVVKMQPISSL